MFINPGLFSVALPCYGEIPLCFLFQWDFAGASANEWQERESRSGMIDRDRTRPRGSSQPDHADVSFVRFAGCSVVLARRPEVETETHPPPLSSRGSHTAEVGSLQRPRMVDSAAPATGGGGKRVRGIFTWASKYLRSAPPPHNRPALILLGPT